MSTAGLPPLPGGGDGEVHARSSTSWKVSGFHRLLMLLTLKGLESRNNLRETILGEQGHADSFLKGWVRKWILSSDLLRHCSSQSLCFIREEVVMLKATVYVAGTRDALAECITSL